jgi:hypothetical protein
MRVEETMRTRLIGIVVGCTVLVGASTASAINCEQVRRYLATGRTVESIAETMIVSVDEVKKCGQAEGENAPATPKPQTSE